MTVIDRRPRWVDAVAPDAAEQALLRERGVPASFIPHALDVAELPRTQVDATGATLVVLRVPEEDGPGGGAIALAVVVRRDRIVTIASQHLALLDRVAAECAPEVSAAALVTELVHAVVTAFERRLQQIDAETERLEQALRTSQRNAEVLALLECQKGLVHLERALTANELLVERLRDDNTLELDGAPHRRLDEALVELRQVKQMTAISAEILASMMDAFASIISNNLNHAMKLMAALTIMLAIPTSVAGIWGMNVPVPGGHSSAAFAVLVGSLFACSLLVGVVFRRRRWL